MPKIEFPIPGLEGVLADHRAALNWVIEREKRSMRERFEELDMLKKSAASSSEIRIAAMASTLDRVLRAERTRRLASQAIRVAIALEDYREVVGAYPERIADLVPTYIDSIPEDPALPGSEILYRREVITSEGRTFRYRLYSRGRNGADDGGTPATWRCGIDLLYHDTERATDILLNAVR